MTELIITTGKPGTGKTTWAREKVEAEKDWKRVGNLEGALFFLRKGINVILDHEALTGFDVSVQKFPIEEPTSEGIEAIAIGESTTGAAQMHEQATKIIERVNTVDPLGTQLGLTPAETPQSAQDVAQYGAHA